MPNNLQRITPQDQWILDSEGNMLGVKNPKANGDDLLPVLYTTDALTGGIDLVAGRSLKLFSKLRRAAIESAIANPFDVQASASCAITGGAWTANLATAFNMSTGTDKFVTEGGVFVSDGNAANYPLKSATVASGNIGVTGAYSVTNAVEFETTAAKVMFKLYVGGGNSQYAAFRVCVDGQYVAKNPQTILGLTGQAAGNQNFIQIDFTSYGGSGIVRKVRFEWDNGVTGGVLSYDTGALWQVVDDRPRVCFFGDSFFAYGSGPTAAAPTYPLGNVAVRAARKLGWRPTCAAVGGTGFINNGGSNYAWNSAQRIADLSLQTFDAYVFCASVNDGGSTASAITAAALAVFQAARAANANAPIFVIGILNGEVSTSLSTTLIENAVFSAWQAFGDNNSYFVKATTDTAGAWITSGNKATYIDPDGTHPLAKVGEEYLAQKIALGIKQAMFV